MDYAAWMQKARDLLFFDRPQEALAAYEKARSLASDQREAVDAAFDGAEVLASLGKVKEAYAIYESIAKTYPDEPGADYGMAYTAEALGVSLEEVIAHYEAAIDKDLNYHRAYYYAGLAYDDLGDKKTCAAYLQKTVELMPQDYVAWNDLGATWEELGDYAKAMEAVERSLAIYPTYVRALYNRGVILHRMGLSDEAEKAYENVLSHHDIPVIYLNLSAMYIEEKRWDLSEKILRRGLVKHPMTASLWYNLSCVLLNTGRREEGVRAMLKAIDCDADAADWMKEDPDVASVLGEIYRRLTDEEEI